MNQGQPDNPAVPPLQSWKEIGAYLHRDVTTVRRWERLEGLPVHRHTHKSRSSVYAYPSEIDAWRASRRIAAEPTPPLPLWKTLLATPRSLAVGLTVALCLLMVGNGVRPQAALAQGKTLSTRRVWLIKDQSPHGAPSADGRYIGYTDWSTGDLGVRDLISGVNHRLTNTGGWVASGDYPQGSAFSPDGTMVAYLWYIDHLDRFELRVIPTEGGSPRTVYRAGQPGEYMFPDGWTPDGKRLLVVRSLDNSSQIALVSVDTGAMRVIKSLGWQDVNAQLSPNGRFIAYDQPADAKTNARDIFLLAADGSSESVIVQSPANDTNPMWSPDGKDVLFVSDRTGSPSLWAVAVQDGKPSGPPTLLRADLASRQPLGITRNGSLYYTTGGNGGVNVYVADLDATMKAIQAPRVVSQQFVNGSHGPEISPDGQYLAYYASEHQIIVRSLKTGEERKIATPQLIQNVFGYGPMWFPDKASVMVAMRDPQRPGITLARLHLADGKTETLVHTGPLQGYALSPDGKSIYYAENDDEEVNATNKIATRLVRFDIATRHETVLKSGAWVISVAVSPDSKQVAYLVSDRGSHGEGATQVRGSHLEVMPAEGGASRVVFQSSPWLDGSRYNGLCWSADGRSLIFVRGGASGDQPKVLWQVPATGGRPQPVGISRRGGIKSLQVSPDGKQLYFTGGEPAPQEMWVLQNFLPETGR
jgi:Tol biopolymer transport system component